MMDAGRACYTRGKVKTMKRKTIDVDHTGTGDAVRVPIDCDTPAEYAAGVVARREYGRAAYVRTCRLDSWAQDGSSATYEAFIGVSDGSGGTVGRNIWVYT